MKKGFTLVELVIVIVIVGILSIIAVPIYKGYIEKAKITEAKATLAAIKTAQDIYFTEHGSYYGVSGNIVQYDDVLDIDLRANKYFKRFQTFDATDHGYASVYDDENTHIVYDWTRPGSVPFTGTSNGVSKRTPYFFLYHADGRAEFI